VKKSSSPEWVEPMAATQTQDRPGVVLCRDRLLAAAKAGTLGSTIQRILADLKPEAAYFYADDSGQRAGSIVFDLKDASQIPAVAEPWFLAFNATLSFRPVMNPQDLANAVPGIAAAVQNYGK
jgi:hypothetical protein